MANYKLTIRTLSPLHIGTGRELCQGFDYIVSSTKTGRLNVEKILDAKITEFEKNPGMLPADLIAKEIGNPAYFRYILDGRPRSSKADSRLRECIKDVNDVPYIPGSSIKGAIRTAFGASIIPGSMRPAAELDLYGSAKYMDNDLEKKLFGKDPQNDLFRALLISDAFLPADQRDPSSVMEVKNTNPISRQKANSSVPVEIECIKGKLEFTASLKIDDHILREKNFPNGEKLSGHLMEIIKAHGEKRLQTMQEWYKESVGAEQVNGFILKLQGFSEKQLAKVNNMALMQMGFGTGWDGMTYSDWLNTDDDFFERLYSAHLRRKQNKGKAPMREPGMVFPGSRKVVMTDEKPEVPLGWVLLTLEPK